MRLQEFGDAEADKIHNQLVDKLDNWLVGQCDKLVNDGTDPQPAMSLLISVLANEVTNVMANMYYHMDVELSLEETKAMYAEISQLTMDWQAKLLARINSTLN